MAIDVKMVEKYSESQLKRFDERLRGKMGIIKIFFIAAVFFVLPLNVLADDNTIVPSGNNIRIIKVTGKSENLVKAHYAIINLEIKHVAKEMPKSHLKLINTISQLTKELVDSGINENDIKKSLILQGPEYEWEMSSRVPKGYYSECELNVYVDNIELLPDIYKKISSFEDISTFGTEFKRNDIFEIRKKEFENALLLARKKAEYMSQTLGVKLGRVNKIEEINSENALYGVVQNFSNDERSEAKTAEYGYIKIEAMVQVEFELQ